MSKESPDMRTKYEKNQDFPLMMSEPKSSKILESLRENYQEQLMMQTSGSSQKFEDFLENNNNGGQMGHNQTPQSMIKSFSQLVQEHGAPKAKEIHEQYDPSSFLAPNSHNELNSQYQAIQLNKQGSQESTMDLKEESKNDLLKSSDLFSKGNNNLQKQIKDNGSVKIQ